uniref:NADH-ubiquinone oxidoreductase chain 5 n=2 Tax=Architeuthis dux TaxID=256136 RepID=B6VJQ8_ARCDU|nr:NADH dehydrogenase subunit 5 [Architeuthis dux]ACJ11918.1 NADH dehydrogenase subunit 5 [Architeuthis dux]AGK37121.1 NADH dehydrogenase subunit 5 [Architeuthis dux]AGK37129.1 NADH dehydrogenase subunit 5 [Architeuthis dux]AGK37137.1 NADH dehydrogenase subunit 5 [Architeuthis dux]AGK37155.1 NADH dehydrogenase subunit 5 [Architeuthis dux]
MFNLIGVELCFSIMLFTWFFFMCLVLVYLCVNNICLLFSWELMNCMSSSVEFDLVIDWMSCSFSGLVCFISGCVMVFTISYMSGDSNLFRFSLTVMLFVLSMNFLIFIPGLVSLLLGWDGLGLVSFCLVIYYQNSKSLAAGMLTVLMNRVGDCFILGAISMMVVLGHWNMLCLWEFHGFMYVNLFIMIAGMTKSAQIPFSSWLPAAMAAPTPVSALVHSSTLVTAGVFLFIRFFNYLSCYYWFSVFMVYISIMTTIMSGVCALYEYDMKKIIALSTLSQLGVMMMSLGLGLPMLALFHLYTHAMFKALLFMCGGNIIHCFSGKQDMRQINNVSKLLPVTSMFLNISNMALCGMPFLAGFYSKDLIIEGLITGNMNMVTFLLGVFGVCLTVMYSVRFSFYIIWGSNSSDVYVNMGDGDMKMIFSMSMLVVGALWGGFVFQSLFCLFSVEFFLPLAMKLIVPFLIFMSLLFSFGFWDSGSMNIKFNMLGYVNSSMWFLSSFVCYPMISGFKFVSNSGLKVVDMGWFEIMGGQGVFGVNKIIFFLLEHWMMLLFNCYMIVFLVVVFII